MYNSGRSSWSDARVASWNSGSAPNVMAMVTALRKAIGRSLAETRPGTVAVRMPSVDDPSAQGVLVELHANSYFLM